MHKKERRNKLKGQVTSFIMSLLVQPESKRLTQESVPSQTTLTKAESLLLAEFDQAWSHYRQNETMRTQYVGFFLTVTLGFAALGANIVTPDRLSQASDIIGYGVFLGVYLLLVSFTYLIVRKVDVAMYHYERLWRSVRNYFYSDVNRTTEPYASIDIRDYLHSLRGGPIRKSTLRIQTTAELLLVLFAFLASSGEVFLTLRLGWIHASPWLVVAQSAIGGTAIVITGLVMWASGTSFRR